RRFNAIEVDEAGDAVLVRPLDEEIRRRLVGSADLGTNPGIAGLQRALREARPVAADRGIKALAAARIHGVVDPVDPFDVGPEARLPGEIERHMDAKPTWLRHGIDEMPEGRATREREIDAATEIIAGNGGCWNAADAPRQARRMNTGAVDERPAAERRRLGTAHLEGEPVFFD